ncbi:hypothetical protein GCM10009780_23460 [Actinomadura alba]
MLAVLLSRPNEVVSTDRLAAALWEETPPKSAVKTMQVYVHHLRRVLGGRSIDRRSGGYVLVTEPDELDVARFEGLVVAGRAAVAERDLDRGIGLLRRALALWRGPAYEGQASMPGVREEAARLGELKLTVTEERTEAELWAGRNRDLVPELTVAVAENPLRERLRAQLMLALHHSGRRAEALTVYREGHAVLATELGLGPGRELRGMQQAILDDALDGEGVTSPIARCPRCLR